MASVCLPETDGEASYEILHVQGCAIVATAGDIDMHSAPYLRDVLEAAVVIAPRIIVDLSEVRFVDSSGLGVLLGVQRRGTRGSIALVRPPQILRRLLGLTRVGETLPAYPSREEALQALGEVT
jgi:anti-sigma B factor antagonist